MKSWADHCSSDEESEGDGRQKSPPPIQNDTPPQLEEPPKDDLPSDDIPPPLPLEDFSTNYETFHQILLEMQGPQYSAHIGNLPFRIHSGEALCHKIEGLVDFRYQGQNQVSVSFARVGTDRETKKPKGYAIVGFDTLDELKILLNLNDGHSFIEGRQIRMDVATSHMKQAAKKYGDVDGSQFRGGKYSRNENSVPHSASMSSVQSSNTPPALTRKKSVASDGNLDRKTSAPQSVASSNPVEKQRPSLKLVPRSKPTDGSGDTREATSDIFGGAKPRDEAAWTSSKATQPSDGDKGMSQHHDQSVVGLKREIVHEKGTLVEDFLLKTESDASGFSKRDKKAHSRGPPRNEERGGAPYRSNNHRDDRSKRDFPQTSKDTKIEKQTNKSKDYSSQAVRGKGSNVDGWEDAPSTQKEKRVVAPVTSTVVQEPLKPAPVKKLANAFELLTYDDSDSD